MATKPEVFVISLLPKMETPFQSRNWFLKYSRVYTTSTDNGRQQLPPLNETTYGLLPWWSVWCVTSCRTLMESTGWPKNCHTFVRLHFIHHNFIKYSPDSSCAEATNSSLNGPVIIPYRWWDITTPVNIVSYLLPLLTLHARFIAIHACSDNRIPVLLTYKSLLYRPVGLGLAKNRSRYNDAFTCLRRPNYSVTM